MSVLMNFSMFPISKAESLSPYVARVLRCIGSKEFPYQLTSMGTIVETSTLSEALQLIDMAYKELENECSRVYVTVSLDIRKGSRGRIKAKVKSVEDKV